MDCVLFLYIEYIYIYSNRSSRENLCGKLKNVLILQGFGEIFPVEN